LKATMRERGTVKWFNDAKGYGFISREGGSDVFVHFSEIRQNGKGRKTLYDDDLVEFEVSTGPKGVQALAVTVVEK